MHGEDDQIVPVDDQIVPVKDSAKKSARLIKGAGNLLSERAARPHSDASDQVNADLLAFLRR